MSKSNNKLLRASISFALLYCPLVAFAYVDPGTGGMVMQALAALMASIVFYVRHPVQLLRDMKAWFSRKNIPSQ